MSMYHCERAFKEFTDDEIKMFCGVLADRLREAGKVGTDPSKEFKFEAVKDAPEDTVLPERKTVNSAGYDFVLPCDVIIKEHGSSKLVFTNIKAKMPRGYYLALFIRSSLAIKKNLMLVNSVGVIDADYYGNMDNDGNIGLKLYNFGNEDVLLKKGERVMQGVFTPYYTTIDDKASQERSGGIGSTGK